MTRINCIPFTNARAGESQTKQRISTVILWVPMSIPSDIISFISSTKGVRYESTSMLLFLPLKIPATITGNWGFSNTLNKIGQNSILEQLKIGNPSILKFSEIVTSSLMFRNAVLRQFLTPWCQYSPLPTAVMLTAWGVCNNVRGSSGRILVLLPKKWRSLIIFIRSFSAEWFILWCTVHFRKLERNFLFFSISSSSSSLDKSSSTNNDSSSLIDASTAVPV